MDYVQQICEDKGKQSHENAPKLKMFSNVFNHLWKMKRQGGGMGYGWVEDTLLLLSIVTS